MGIWGVEVFQNDTSLDVKARFQEEIRMKHWKLIVI